LETAGIEWEQGFASLSFGNPSILQPVLTLTLSPSFSNANRAVKSFDITTILSGFFEGNFVGQGHLGGHVNQLHGAIMED
jgi:hypothetical protein